MLGFASGDTIDVASVGFVSGTPVAGFSGGTPTVSSNGQTAAAFSLSGSYSAGAFQRASTATAARR